MHLHKKRERDYIRCQLHLLSKALLHHKALSYLADVSISAINNIITTKQILYNVYPVILGLLSEGPT